MFSNSCWESVGNNSTQHSIDPSPSHVAKPNANRDTQWISSTPWSFCFTLVIKYLLRSASAKSSQTLLPWRYKSHSNRTRFFTAPSAFRSFPNNCQFFGAYKMADKLTCVSVLRVDHASTAFHHSPGGWAAELFMAFPFMACCSVSHELLGKIPDSYYEPLKPMRLHLLWHNIHITSLVLDHMESSLLNLA